VAHYACAIQSFPTVITETVGRAGINNNDNRNNNQHDDPDDDPDDHDVDWNGNDNNHGNNNNNNNNNTLTQQQVLDHVQAKLDLHKVFVKEFLRRICIVQSPPLQQQQHLRKRKRSPLRLSMLDRGRETIQKWKELIAETPPSIDKALWVNAAKEVSQLKRVVTSDDLKNTDEMNYFRSLLLNIADRTYGFDQDLQSLRLGV
jgi:hypothetical protein